MNNPLVRFLGPSIFRRFLTTTSATLLLAASALAFAIKQFEMPPRPAASAAIATPAFEASPMPPPNILAPTAQPATATPSPTATQGPAATVIAAVPKYKEHVVQPGENMGGISLNPSQLEAMKRSNEDSHPDPNKIYPGQILLIPTELGIALRAAENDTVQTLADRRRVLTDMLIAEPTNRLTRSDQPLEAEQVLFVPVPLDVLQEIVGPGARGGGVFDPSAVALAQSFPQVEPHLSFAFPTQAHWLSGYDFAPTHPGLDFYGTFGTPVYAAASGTISFADLDKDGQGQVQGYGLNVVIAHEAGLSSQYAHLSQTFVAAGDAVQARQLIGLIGSSGNTTGPHLHFEIRYRGVPVTPWEYLKP